MYKSNLEIKTYVHKGIDVSVRIDYENMMVSLVEKETHSIPSVYKNKGWIFANRTSEYLDSWLDIFDAMKFAVQEAQKLLAEQVKKNQEEIEKKSSDMIHAAKYALENYGFGSLSEKGKEVLFGKGPLSKKKKGKK